MHELLGIDLDALVCDEVQQGIPIVPGRVAQIDGDFAAYQVACNEERSWKQIVHNLEVLLETHRLMCGAEHMQIHLTGSGSTKGGRYEQALLKEYQANRKREKPSRLEDVRVYLEEEYNAMYWMDREADDGMAYMQMEYINRGERHLSCIVSADKDLRIVQGLHLCPDTNDIVDVNGYGSLFIKDMKSGKKLLGWGPAFLYAQLLMGDAADNISGLPKLVTIADDHAVKAKPCGPVAAYNVLKECTSCKEAFKLVAKKYLLYSEHIGFKDYRTGEACSASTAFLSELNLLNMRTDKDAAVLTEIPEWIRGNARIA